jgi:hypothetical protein
MHGEPVIPRAFQTHLGTGTGGDFTGSSMRHKILIMGLPGAGKTTLARALAPRLPAVHLNADQVRRHISKDLGFSEADRVEHARRMGWLADRIVEAGAFVIADFICPTPQARGAFTEGGAAFVVWVDRIRQGRFEDTNRLFVAPQHFDVRVTPGHEPEHWAEKIAALVRPTSAGAEAQEPDVHGLLRVSRSVGRRR